jgi:hypothetical protein
LAIFSGLARNKSDAGNNTARLCGILSVILLFSSGVLIALSLYLYMGAKNTTGYSFTLMAIAQFLSFLAAMLVAHWMVNIKKMILIQILNFYFYSRDIHLLSLVK